MPVWIDATHPGWKIRIYGMSLLERALRTCADIGIRAATVIVRPGTDVIPALRPDFGSRIDMRIHQLEWDGDPAQSLLDALRGSTSRLLALQAHAVYDPRILKILAASDSSAVACDPAVAESPLAATLARDDIAWLESLEENLARALPPAAAAGNAQLLIPEQISAYNPVLRNRTNPFLICVTDESSTRTAYAVLYESSFKGSIDFAAYAYKYLVRWIVARLAPTGITPDQVTWLGVILSFVAAACYAVEAPWMGTLLLGIVVLCDSIDGKLARLTHRVGDFGGVLDSVTNFATLELSSLAIGYHLADGKLQDLPFIAGVAFVGAYSIDRAVCLLFKRNRQAMLYDYTPFEFHFRRFAARRTNIVFAWLLGLLTGYFLQAHYLVALWAVATLAVHTIRSLWIIARRIPPDPDLHPKTALKPGSDTAPLSA